ncbi:RICIN domain-containing protein [Streptomyces tropicalis]|uniref:RICIN domain-containing protein n=1 Tax=Streptomyces tropicalis TaxID=3034234 RepID=UPI0028BF3EA8|nr:RICIN domain-containing protein [Streptomyces tropicalis]
MNDPGLVNSAEHPRRFDTTDEELSAELRKWTGGTPAVSPVGELLDRHWEAGCAYARLCTDGPHPAGMLTTAAFTRLFGQSLRQSGPTAAWRPHLLLAVRRIAAEWAADHRLEMLHPELRAASGDGPGAAALLLPPDDRRLLSQAFQRLPQTARAVLWHTEVEAEPLASPARLLGLDEEGARIELRRARERLREECLQVHRELAPEQDCLRYFRLLDVTYRRLGVALDPDLAGHLAGCTHCRHTAEQLGQFTEDLGGALAEGVLGWGAREYRAARLEEAAADEAPPAVPPKPAVPPGAAAAAAGSTAASARTASAIPAPDGPLGGESFGSPASGGPVAGEAFGYPAGAEPWGADVFGGPVGGEPFGAAARQDGRAAPPRAGSSGFAPGRLPDAASGLRSRSASEAGTGALPGAAAGRGVSARAAARRTAAGRIGAAARSAAAGMSAAAGRPGPSGEAGRRAAAPSRRSGPASAPAGAPARSGNQGSGPRTALSRAARRAARRAGRRRTLAVAVATVSGLVVVPLVLWSVLGSDDAPAPGGRSSGTPGAAPAGSASGGPGPAASGRVGQAAPLRGRLRNAASGLCVGLTGGKAVRGAEAELAACSGTPGQQWSYEPDGLLRSAAAPDLCLDSHLGYSVQLAPCTGASGAGAKNVRYDFTLQGTLVPRFDQNLALTPAATDGAGSLVLKTRTDGRVQRWTLDAASPDLQPKGAERDAAGGPSASASASAARTAAAPLRAPGDPAAVSPTSPTSVDPSAADPCASSRACTDDGPDLHGRYGHAYRPGHGGRPGR